MKARPVCSTPCGITEVGTLDRSRSFSWTRCAQRLAASQRSAQVVAVPVCPHARVLNALRHHRGRHSAYRCPDDRSPVVLNALRHHRGRHSIPLASLRGPSRCAQRLAASQRSARSGRETPKPHLHCAQRLAASQRSARSCLSAPCRSPAPCAQRLAASQRSARRAILLSLLDTACAQRLAASQRSARCLPSCSMDSTKMCSTPCGITEVGTPIIFTGHSVPAMCSTPCGITEVGTRPASVARTSSSVCSTPCGITEVGTRSGTRSGS